MSSLNTNGRKRPSLAEQLNRLDGILDGLADGLQEAVVTAVKEAVGLAVQQAVQAALGELLAHPALRERLRPVPEKTDTPSTPEAGEEVRTELGWLTTLLGAGWAKGVALVQQA